MGRGQILAEAKGETFPEKPAATVQAAALDYRSTDPEVRRRWMAVFVRR